MTKPCAICTRPIRRHPSRFRTSFPTCSPACRGALVARNRITAACPVPRQRWRGGYLYVHVGRDHHLADSRGYAPLGRVMAEAKMARRLAPNERVEFLNGEVDDFRPENLIVKRLRVRMARA